MTDNDKSAPDTPLSVLIIQFAAPGAAEFQIKSENVTPAQLLAAATWLDWYARRMFDAVVEQRNVAVPQVVLPSNLKGH